ncbi:ABC transporter permease [Alkalibacillus salilacus]|uniref:ABC-2 type transport system permease protein n=1 Tax=Alkalibacillus salilacus TaxID=284582 RepID=A0ABT9VB98_9BACI|nr:ABC transporter permease [Alkalibacillus salilacus]MDQ0158245.1 ABC-2 type transport system permease protein [Alkalibacillus salilacus]
MRNSLKVGKWEMKRNLKSKSFLISLFLTPLIFIFFATVPNLLMDDGSGDENGTTVYVNDSIGAYSMLESITQEQSFLSWNLEETDQSIDEAQSAISSEDAFIQLNEETLENGVVSYVTGDDVSNQFTTQLQTLEQPIKQMQIQQADLNEEQMALVSSPIQFQAQEASAESEQGNMSSGPFAEDPFENGIPALFGGIVLFSIVITGMMIFQSASQEKKEKVAEIVLSSVTPNELMQGKIIGYFALGLIQVTAWMVFIIPLALYLVDDIPIMEYLLTPQLLLFVLIAILGYLLFASLFVGLGATLEDASSGSNFQGMVMMLPFLPVVLIGPILADPNGLAAQIGTFIPFTSPAVLLIRLALIDQWPWVEILIGLAILIVSIWLFMKLAGKIFKVGILIYGKNATPQEIWKWLRA